MAARAIRHAVMGGVALRSHTACKATAVLVDIGGCLLETRHSITDTYQDYARKHGLEVSREQIKAGFKAGFSEEGWPASRGLRYVGEGRPFWRHVVAQCMGTDDEALFEDLFQIVSNFDTRLRPLMEGMGILGWFDAVVVSAEVGAEKPDPAIFRHAMEALGVADPAACLMVGDDARNDVGGGRGVGMDVLLWGEDVRSFDEVADRVLGGG